MSFFFHKRKINSLSDNIANKVATKVLVELINISNLSYKYHKTDVLENINLIIKDDDF